MAYHGPSIWRAKYISHPVAPRPLVELMDLSNEYRRIQSHPEALSVVLEILLEQPEYDDRSEFLKFILPKITNAVSARYVAVATASAGQWRAEPPVGRGESLPLDLLADVLDTEETKCRQSWLVAPLVTRVGAGSLLIAELKSSAREIQSSAFDALAAAVGLSLHRVQTRQRGRRRVRRLEAILEIAGQWNQHREMESLLNQMAEASTRLLGAERASIFLWDRVRDQLVGRPALGVDGAELRISDQTGVVGQVVHTGEVRRVDEDTQQQSIDRHVDQQLGFQTRSLLCVPLRGRSDEIFGAFEMINKIGGNFTEDDEIGLVELASHAAIALENSQHYQQLLTSRKQVTDQAAEGVNLIGETRAVRELRDTIQRVARTELAVLILGENGTGKEVVSRMVHYLSHRRDNPFIAVNCAALTETLLESELFGHERGAFTDAHESRPGKFESASGGTLFLDEIGDLSLAGQAKLLRVLEEKLVVRVGGSLPIPTDTRVIAATNQDLAAMVGERRFREDLYFRLNVVTLEMPPLRERIEDILVLAQHFLDDFAIRAHRKLLRLTPAAQTRLRQHAWPGNVRELRNLMERLAYLSPAEDIDESDLAFIVAPGREGMPALSLDLGLPDATRLFQIDYIRKNIAAAGGNMSDAAHNLGLHRSNLYRKMRQLGMPGSEEEPA